MMVIKVLGGGCSKCKLLKETVEIVLEQMGREEKVEYITDMSEIIAAGIAVTPALMIDGKIVCAGRVPDQDEIKEWINI